MLNEAEVLEACMIFLTGEGWTVESFSRPTQRGVDITAARGQGMNGQQAGDPAKLAAALVDLLGSDDPPVRWVAGADAVEAVEGKARTLLAQVDAHRELSSSLAHDEVAA